MRGLSCYYSGNSETGVKPEPEFNNTSYVQRIGFSPPDNKKILLPVVKEMIKRRIRRLSHLKKSLYPQYAMRGTVSNEKETKDVEIKSE